MKRFNVLFVFGMIALLVFAPSADAQAQYTIKFASIAPDGSTWMNVMREYDAAVRKESGGRVGFKMYPGMTQGDEKTVIRKISIGQIQSAGFTGVGLGEIAPIVRILDTPYLVRTTEEADNLYEKFEADFRNAFEASGYVFLGWTEVGFVYVYSNAPINKPADVTSLKMWVWDGDPVAESALKSMDVKPIPLSIDNVRTSLQTGLINAFYTTPYAAIALQWYTQAKYIVDFPLTCSVGAVLLSKKYFDNLPKDIQDILIRNGRTYMRKLTELGRKDNQNSLVELKKRGIVFTSVKESEAKEYVAAGIRARRMLVGRLYDEQFMKRVEQAVEDFRKSKKGGK